MDRQVDWLTWIRLAIIALALWTIWHTPGAMLWIAITVLFASLLSPLVSLIQHLGVPRQLSILVVYAILVAAVLGIVLLVLPLAVDQFVIIVQQIPSMTRQLQRVLEDLQSTYQAIYLPPVVFQSLQSTGQLLVTKLGSFVNASVTTLLSGVSFLSGLLIVPLLGYYLLRDSGRLKEGMVAVFPPSWQPWVRRWFARITVVLNGFLRAQVIIGVVTGLVKWFGLRLIGMQYALLVGVITGLTNPIPYIGGYISTALALGLAAFQGWHVFWLTVIVVLVSDQILAVIAGPVVFQSSLGLAPFWTIVSLLVGGELFGFWGLILAVPMAAVVYQTWLIVLDALQGEAPPEDPPDGPPADPPAEA